MGDIGLLDATAQAELVRTRQIDPTELIEAAIERIELLNPAINAVVTPMYDRARMDGATHSLRGPFGGVPFLLKDLIARYAGSPLTEGSAFLRDYVPDHDSELVTRIKQAGLVIVGKTNTPEFGILGTTEPRLFGPTRNPWDPSRSAGGSSGGAAAAVASGMVAMAHASDAAGSIRIPASCCGVFGFKPSEGRVSVDPARADTAAGLWTEHVITRSVRDSAAMLDAITGSVFEATPRTGSIRIAFSAKAPTGVPVHLDCIDAVRDAAHLCERLGHVVEEDAPPLSQEILTDAFDVVWTVCVAAAVEGWIRIIGRRPDGDELEPLTWALLELGSRRSGPDYLRALGQLQTLAREVARFHRGFDVWLTPTLAHPPPGLGWFDFSPDEPLRGYVRDSEFCAFTPLANFTGQPSMSVPLSWNREGLPIGVQFTARVGEDDLLLSLGAQLEEAREWAQRPPHVPGAAPDSSSQDGE